MKGFRVIGGLLLISLFLLEVVTACRSTGTGCISSGSTACVGLADGDYQSCSDCTTYHSCSGGRIWPGRQCPLTNNQGLRGRLVWQQITANQGICTYTSTSCTECVLNRRSDIFELLSMKGRSSGCNTGTSSGTRCITADANSCIGLGYGDYQACERCTVYHSCYEGVNYANRDCPAGLVWVSETFGSGHCDWSSDTCRPCP